MALKNKDKVLILQSTNSNQPCINMDDTKRTDKVKLPDLA